MGHHVAICTVTKQIPPLIRSLDFRNITLILVFLLEANLKGTSFNWSRKHSIQCLGHWMYRFFFQLSEDSMINVQDQETHYCSFQTISVLWVYVTTFFFVCNFGVTMRYYPGFYFLYASLKDFPVSYFDGLHLIGNKNKLYKI